MILTAIMEELQEVDELFYSTNEGIKDKSNVTIQQV